MPIGQDFKREPPGLGSGPQSTRAFPGPSVEGRGAIGDLAGSGGQPRRPLAGARALLVKQAGWAPEGASRRADHRGAVWLAAAGTEQPPLSGRPRLPHADFLSHAAEPTGAARRSCRFSESSRVRSRELRNCPSYFSFSFVHSWAVACAEGLLCSPRARSLSGT